MFSPFSSSLRAPSPVSPRTGCRRGPERPPFKSRRKISLEYANKVSSWKSWLHRSLPRLVVLKKVKRYPASWWLRILIMSANIKSLESSEVNRSCVPREGRWRAVLVTPQNCKLVTGFQPSRIFMPSLFLNSNGYLIICFPSRTLSLISSSLSFRIFFPTLFIISLSNPSVLGSPWAMYSKIMMLL